MVLPEVKVPEIKPRLAVFGFVGKPSTGKSFAMKHFARFLSERGIPVETADIGILHREASKEVNEHLAHYLENNSVQASEVDDQTDGLTLAYLETALGYSEWKDHYGGTPGPVLLLSGRLINHLAGVLMRKGKLPRDAMVGTVFHAAEDKRVEWLLANKNLPNTKENHARELASLILRDETDRERLKDKYNGTEFAIPSWWGLWSKRSNDVYIRSDQTDIKDEMRIIAGTAVELGVLPIAWAQSAGDTVGNLEHV